MIQIKNSDRVAFVGATGFGKTVLAKYFLSRLNRVVVIDPKHTFKLDGFKKSWTLPMVSKQFNLIMRPKLSEDSRLFETIYKLYKLGNVTIYCDEMATLSEMFPQTDSLLQDIARTGRERRVALWSAMQRPRGTPRVYLTESELFFCFNLRSREDRQYISGFAGDEVLQKIPRFYFWHIRPDSPTPSLLTLDVESGQIKAGKELKDG